MVFNLLPISMKKKILDYLICRERGHQLWKAFWKKEMLASSVNEVLISMPNCPISYGFGRYMTTKNLKSKISFKLPTVSRESYTINLQLSYSPGFCEAPAVAFANLVVVRLDWFWLKKRNFSDF